MYSGVHCCRCTILIMLRSKPGAAKGEKRYSAPLHQGTKTAEEEMSFTYHDQLGSAMEKPTNSEPER